MMAKYKKIIFKLFCIYFFHFKKLNLFHLFFSIKCESFNSNYFIHIEIKFHCQLY